MITPKELLEKVEKSFFRIVQRHLKGGEYFPWLVPANKQITGNNYSDWKTDLVPLHKESKQQKGKGYSVEWTEKKINGIRQSVPAKIFFETLEDYLSFTGRKKDFEKIIQSKTMIISTFPSLEDWTNDSPTVLLENSEIWPEVLKVCQYFYSNNPPYTYYVRELPIEVHSKFIEQNSSLLRKLLDQLLPPGKLNTNESDFAARYFLKKVSTYTQIRVLDDDLKPHLGYDECTLTLEDAAWIKWLPEKVFIIENQICYLTFPKVKNAVAIFGEGFKSRLSQHIPWLAKTKLFCWFDLDTAGFEMLNMIRQHYPDSASFLMNEETYNQHRRFDVTNKGRKKDLRFLDPEEQKLYQFLLSNNKRLEQERIPQQYVLEKLEAII
jgi:hypothetical protein